MHVKYTNLEGSQSEGMSPGNFENTYREMVSGGISGLIVDIAICISSL